MILGFDVMAMLRPPPPQLLRFIPTSQSRRALVAIFLLLFVCVRIVLGLIWKSARSDRPRAATVQWFLCHTGNNAPCFKCLHGDVPPLRPTVPSILESGDFIRLSLILTWFAPSKHSASCEWVGGSSGDASRRGK